MTLKNSKIELKNIFFPKSARMMCTKFQVSNSKTVTSSLRTDRWTDIQTNIERTKTGETRGNRNTWPGSVLVSKQYRFVKQCWLGNITGLYRVQVNGKVLVSPSAFRQTYIHYSTCRYTEDRNRESPGEVKPKYLAGLRTVVITLNFFISTWPIITSSLFSFSAQKLSTLSLWRKKSKHIKNLYGQIWQCKYSSGGARGSPMTPLPTTSIFFQFTRPIYWQI